ncbi:MAG: hypothetical protein ACE5J7_03680 [Candidatus Aenigmatarchaeota archaeon]
MEILTQMIALMALLIGIFVGEMITFRAFGRPKAKALIVDMFIFVVVLVLIFNFVSFTALGWLFYLVNFIVGMLSIVMVRGIEASIKLTDRPKEGEKIAVNIVRTLSRYGLDDNEIKSVLKRSGLSPRSVDKLAELVEKNVPHYVPKLVKIEADLEEIKAGIASISTSLTKLRMNELVHLKKEIARLKAKKAKRNKRTKKAKRKRK